MSARKKRAPKTSAYSLARPIPPGTVLSDIYKRQWIVGKPIAQGGFGCIYSAKVNGENVDNFVVKIEPLENGPLFTEIHFYMRACTKDAISKWVSHHRLDFLGIPRYVSSGQFVSSGQGPCRFLIMDRFSHDFESALQQGLVKVKNVFKVAIHVLNALEFLHSNGYAHADIKASNLLYTRSVEEVTLVDFGLVFLFRASGVHRPAKTDPKFQHNGTLEFCSRDSHNALPPSRRGDLEILLFNLVHWLARCQPGASQSFSTGLPWGHLISAPKLRQNVPNSVKMQVARIKDEVMQNVQQLMAGTGLSPSTDLLRFMQAIMRLQYDETPDYTQLRRYLLASHQCFGSTAVKITKSMVDSVSSKRASTELLQSVDIKQLRVGAEPPTPQSLSPSTSKESVTQCKPTRNRPAGSKPRRTRKPVTSTPVILSTDVDRLEVKRPPKVKKKVTQPDQPFDVLANPSPLENKTKLTLKHAPSPPHVRSSPRLKALSNGSTHLRRMVWDSEDESPPDVTVRPPKKSIDYAEIAEPSGRKVLTPLNPSTDGVRPKMDSFAQHQADLASRRRSGFCQTSPELLLLAKAEALRLRTARFDNRNALPR